MEDRVVLKKHAEFDTINQTSYDMYISYGAQFHTCMHALISCMRSNHSQQPHEAQLGNRTNQNNNREKKVNRTQMGQSHTHGKKKKNKNKKQDGEIGVETTE